ncbi:MAG: hypothetical protein LBB21_05870 [Holosporaceae bacterium]|jgi:hypothetical protein|nr:hypothetical protein [Holosporaceae bacterium]
MNFSKTKILANIKTARMCSNVAEQLLSTMHLGIILSSFGYSPPRAFIADIVFFEHDSGKVWRTSSYYCV